MELTFTARIVRVGGSNGIIIPKALCDNLNKGQKYLFSVKEIEKEGTEKNGENSTTDLD